MESTRKWKREKKKPRSGIRIAVVKVGSTKTKTKKTKKRKKERKKVWEMGCTWQRRKKGGVSERPRWNWFGKAVVVESMRRGIGMLEKWRDG